MTADDHGAHLLCSLRHLVHDGCQVVLRGTLGKEHDGEEPLRSSAHCGNIVGIDMDQQPTDRPFCPCYRIGCGHEITLAKAHSCRVLPQGRSYDDVLALGQSAEH